MKPLESPDDISEIAFGFMASKALFASLHVDIFGALSDGPKTVPSLSRSLGIVERRLETLVTALVAVGLLTRNGARVANSPASEQYLVRENPNYFGDYLRYQIDRQMYPFMANLEKVLVGESGEVDYATYGDWMADEAQAELFSRSQHSGSLGPGAILARKLELGPDATALLDVGGGSGAFSIMFCKRYPALKATVIDFPNVIEIGREFVAGEKLEDRIAFVAADGTEHDWPRGQDVVLMSYLLSGVPADSIPGLCAEAWRVLKPGGLLAVHDFMVTDERAGPPLAALWQLQHMVYTPDGVGLTPGFLDERMRGAGFEIVDNAGLIAGMTRVMVGRKPARG